MEKKDRVIFSYKAGENDPPDTGKTLTLAEWSAWREAENVRLFEELEKAMAAYAQEFTMFAERDPDTPLN